jgi:hypothetical protein
MGGVSLRGIGRREVRTYIEGVQAILYVAVVVPNDLLIVATKYDPLNPTTF